MDILKNWISFLFVFLLGCGLLPVKISAQPTNGVDRSAIEPDTLTPKQERVLVDLLNGSLQSLAEKDRRGRQIGGYVLLGLGIGSGLGGTATLAFGEGDDARTVGYSLLGGGALLSGLSLIPFRVRSETERMYSDFRQMPEDNPGQIQYKYHYWDRRFQELADKRRNERIIGGVTTIVAAAMTSFVVVKGSDKEQLHTFLWLAIGGVTALLAKSDEERRYETYRRAREDIIGQASGLQVNMRILPMPGVGLIGAVQLQF